MLKNGQTHDKNLAVFIPQDIKSMFGHFSTLYMKGLKMLLYYYFVTFYFIATNANNTGPLEAKEDLGVNM